MEELIFAVGQVAGPEIPGRQAEVPAPGGQTARLSTYAQRFHAQGRSRTSLCFAAQGFHALVSLAAQKRWNVQQFFLQTVAR